MELKSRIWLTVVIELLTNKLYLFGLRSNGYIAKIAKKKLKTIAKSI